MENNQENKEPNWWGYVHTNGSVHLKPIWCDYEANSPFVEDCIPPFYAKNREEAEQMVRDKKIKLSYW